MTPSTTSPSPIPARRLPWDWYPGTLPENTEIDPEAYVETTFSFHLFRSRLPVGVRIGRGASTYLGTMFDVGPAGCVTLGAFALVHGARIICDARVEIGDHALISWNVVLMDNPRFSPDTHRRREALRQLASGDRHDMPAQQEPRPIRVGNNTWIGFDSCIMPGVTIGDGAIVGAKSVVYDDVAPGTIVAGNPARFIRRIESPAPPPYPHHAQGSA